MTILHLRMKVKCVRNTQKRSGKIDRKGSADSKNMRKEDEYEKNNIEIFSINLDGIPVAQRLRRRWI